MRGEPGPAFGGFAIHNRQIIPIRDSVTDILHSPGRPLTTGPAFVQFDPAQMRAWVVARRDKVIARWLSEVTKRLERRPRQLVELLENFYDTFVRILPEVLGPYRRRVRPLWHETANLYGEFAAQRGLVTGEVIEEFQVLRVSLIRVLYAEPLTPPDLVPALREVLRLNQFVDQGVTHACIGYTDSLFSTLVEGPGVPESLTEEVLTGVARQLEGIRGRFRDIVGAGRV